MSAKVGIRTRQKSRTRDRLVAAAQRRFALNGIVATTTADVAEAAGVAHGTLFVHFPSRDDLVMAVLDEFAIRVPARVRGLALSTTPGLREVLSAHAQAVSEQESLYAALVLERRQLPPASRSRLVILQSAVAYIFRDAAQREIAAGRVRRLPLGPLFNMWLALLHHYACNGDLFAEGPGVLRERGAQLVEQFMQMVQS